MIVSRVIKHGMMFLEFEIASACQDVISFISRWPYLVDRYTD